MNLKALGILFSVIGAGASIAGGIVDDKKRDEVISEKMNEKMPEVVKEAVKQLSKQNMKKSQ